MIAPEATAALAHGGRLTEARRLFPGAPEPWVDLSTGINPVPYPLPDLSPDCFTRLPEPDAEHALRAIAARAYGAADAALVAAAPGTQMLIDLIPRLWPARGVAVLGPTYAEHAHAWAKQGARVSTVGAFDALDGAEVAVVVNPNNPDGQRTPPARLLGLADRMAARGGLLLVDEAFADLEGAGIAAALPHPGLIVLRSFGKTYGLAGLRLGFALAGPERAAAIRAALGPWAVSGPALAIGARALADGDWLAATAARLAAECRDLDALLAAAGPRVVGGTKLFRLAEGDAPAMFGRLGEAGIFVRRFAEHPRWLRFGLPGTPEAWARLRRVLVAR
jgi:cobalamin biosynthetic protein CobC